MDNPKEFDFIQDIDELVAMPAIAMDLLSMLNEPGMKVIDIVDKVKLDEALVVHILKNCNSPLYGVRKEIKSLTQAINLLGYSNIRTILMAYFMRNLYAISGKDDLKKQLWEHSVSVAAFSQALAGLIGYRTEEAYLAGLIHDIGKLAMVVHDRERFSEVIKEIKAGGEDSIVVENWKFNFTHIDVGYQLLNKWEFADLLKEVVLYHHAYLHFEGRNRAVGIVALANLLVHQHFDQIDFEAKPFLKRLKVSQNKIESVIEEGLVLRNHYLQGD